MEMMSRRTNLFSLAAVVAVMASVRKVFSSEAAPAARLYPFSQTDAQWRQVLKPDQFHVLRQAGTERPGSSPLNKEKRAGIFHCAGCALPLFSSASKFESGTGWPSFWQPLDKAVVEVTDSSLFMKRTEVLCSHCGGHLGHVFDDGPKPTGLRYCINGVSLNFTAV